MEDIKTKKCHNCGEELPLSEFYKDKDKKDGLNVRCKECEKERVKDWRKNNPVKVRIMIQNRKINIIRKLFHLHTLIRFNSNANSLLLNHEYNNIKSKI